VFATYMALKGLAIVVLRRWASRADRAAGRPAAGSLMMRPVIRRQSEGMENRNKSLKALFAIPLVFSAALLSFAHGANDVANAVGPLAAIVHAVAGGRGGRGGGDPAVGDGDRGAGAVVRAGAVRAEADPHRRLRDHPAERRCGPIAWRCRRRWW
jgi:phosphate/sulfate permease